MPRALPSGPILPRNEIATPLPGKSSVTASPSIFPLAVRSPSMVWVLMALPESCAIRGFEVNDQELVVPKGQDHELPLAGEVGRGGTGEGQGQNGGHKSQHG